MKKYFVLSLFLLVCVGIIYAAVQVQNITLKNYKFELSSGDRIIVIHDAKSTYIKITPSTAKVFDYTVPNGKVLNGVLAEK